MPKKLTDEVLRRMRERVSNAVAEGFDTDEQIIDSAVECFCDGNDVDASDVRRNAQRFLKQALANHLASQSDWPETTDCDKLDSAFKALEEAGIVCRQNFSCCGTCGSAEIVDEMKAAPDTGREIRGYCFYHMQDTESAVVGHGLYLNYGSTVRAERAWVDTGREIDNALKKAGLKTRWNGRLSDRLFVEINWKRRRQKI